MNHSRRKFLAIASLTPLAAIGAHSALAATACNDPASLTLAQRNMRRGLGYIDIAPDPSKRCGLCAFFKPTSGTCGACQMMNGGPAEDGSVCRSFAPQP